MKIIKITYISIVIMMLLTGCYVPARKVHHFETNQTDKIWLQGRELVKLEKDSVEIVVSYDYTLHGVATFDLAISNNAKEIFLIDPIKFYCVFTNKFNEEIISNALNPEIILYKSDKFIERYHADNLSNSQTDLLFSLFNIAEDIHNRDKTEEEKQQDSEKRNEWEQRSERTEQRNLNKIDQLSNDRKFIENNALRKTTLFPGQQMGGKLFFDLVYDIKKLILYFPIGDRIFELEYERKSFK